MKRWLLILGVIFNLELLGYFKYAVFIMENAALAFGDLWSIKPVVLPLAISFFTFQKISYLVGLQYERNGATAIFQKFVVHFFLPPIIRGPIVHHYEILPQLENLGRKGDAFVVSGRHNVLLCRLVQEGDHG